MSYDFFNNNDLEIIEFKNSKPAPKANNAQAAKNLGKALDKKLKL